MTPDAAFGHERRGTPDALAELGRKVGFEVVIIPSLEVEGRPVRSSDIRAAIAAGDLDSAERLLARPYAVTGRMAGDVLRFAVPVALPPSGTYETSAGPIEIDEGGSVHLQASAGPDVRLEFRRRTDR